MIRLLFITSLLSMGMSLTDCKKDTGDNELLTIDDLLVKSNEITGWTKNAGWVANSSSELTNYIDGGAELYISHGFVEAAGQKYSGNISDQSSEITLVVYDLKSAENVAALFDDPNLDFSSAQVWSDQPAGTTAKYMRYGGLSQFMAFSRDNYFVTISIMQDTEESLSIIKQFALNVDGKIKEMKK